MLITTTINVKYFFKVYKTDLNRSLKQYKVKNALNIAIKNYQKKILIYLSIKHDIYVLS